jgi:hypothetical protein
MGFWWGGGEHEGKRQLDRPRRIRADNIKRDLKEI